MLSSLTGIRGYAVLLVLFLHASNHGFNLHESLVFSGAGRYGVFLFFVPSSFLLIRQFFIREKNQSKFVFLSHYFLRRFLRIFPLYFVCLSVYLLVSLFMQSLYIDIWQTYANSLLLLDDPSIFWTIPVEFQYYFVLPIVSFCLLTMINSPLIAVTVTAVFIFVWQSLFQPDYKLHLPSFLSIFITGSFAAYVYEWGNRYGPKIIQSGWFIKSCNLVSFISFLSFIGLISHFYNMLLGVNVERGYFHYEFILWAILSSVLVLSTLWSDGFLRTLFESKFMTFWGDVSFSAYLGHMLILSLLTYFYVDWGGASVVVFISLVALFSYISFRFLERPMSKVHNFKGFINNIEIRSKF